MHNKIAAGNVPATADISFTILVEAKENSYSCTLHNYMFHTVNGKIMPVDKAAMIKDYKRTTNIEKLLILRSYESIFTALKSYMDKEN